MKNKYYRYLLHSVVFASVLGGSIAYAGTSEMAPAHPVEAPAKDVVSGTFNLDFNSHFFSYGNDVWDDGKDAFTPGFYPSVELAFALPAGFSATLGVWSEVHDKTHTANTLGGNINEIDIYGGLAYTIDKFTVGVTYQNWFYPDAAGRGATEEILDIKLSYDTFLSPSLLIHDRLDAGGAASFGGDEGTILILGLSHSIKAGPVTFSFPFNLAYFVDDGFHSTTGKSGFGYGSIAVNASVPLSSLIGTEYGDWSLHAGVTYYVTNKDVVGVGTNPEDSFFTTNIGLSLAF